MTFFRHVREFRRTSLGHPPLFWGRFVSHPLASVVAYLLFRTPVTANQVTVAGLVVHVVTAALVLTAPIPIPVPIWLLIVVAWQFAFVLDCADGQLARSRHQASAFGAWFDQLVDVVSHGIVFTSLTIFLVKALAIEPVVASVLTGTIVTANMLQMFASWQRVTVMGANPVIDPAGRGFMPILIKGEQLLDHGAFLFISAVLLLWPQALLVYILLASAIAVAAAGSQLALNWFRYQQERRAAAARADATSTARPTGPVGDDAGRGSV